MNLAFPYHLDGRGRSTTSGEAEHVRELIEQILFTAPGERINRPQFGTGLDRLLFGAASPEVASATEHLIQSALLQFLGDRARVEKVSVVPDESALRIIVQYLIPRTRERASAEFVRRITTDL